MSSEHQPDESLGWRKSTVSAQGDCVEVATAAEAVFVRDSKGPGPVLRLTTSEWTAFLAGVRKGEFDLT